MTRLFVFTLFLTSACTTSGKAWLREPLTSSDAFTGDESVPRFDDKGQPSTRGLAVQSRTLGTKPGPLAPTATASSPNAVVTDNGTKSQLRKRPKTPVEGRVLGTFRNTYYDFPSESDFGGESVTLFDAQCKPLAQVTKGFYDALCVQGSGLLARGNAVSFNRRDCECAKICEKTQQRICFDSLDLAKFPWGRGATGQAITPLYTVAVDSNVIALGTSIYIPEFDGLPRDISRSTVHDGCFIAQDRGLKIKGQHVDVFTGQTAMTSLWNGLVPSNSGVTVVLDNPKCNRNLEPIERLPGR